MIGHLFMGNSLNVAGGCVFSKLCIPNVLHRAPWRGEL